jgi:hypothetical protein
MGKGLLLAIAIDMADHQAKKHYEETGKHETDALASRHIKKR